MAPAPLMLLSALASLAAVVAGQVAAACIDGKAVLSGRIVAVAPPAGTGRLTAALDAPPHETVAPVLVVIDGVIAPSRAGREAADAAGTVARAVIGRTGTLFSAGDETDRHGRRHGSLRLDDGDGLAERLLQAGAALAEGAPSPCVRGFLDAETAARAERRGIWRQSRLWTELERATFGLPDFVLARGRVASVGQAGRTTYINFGDDFRTDATVRLTEAVASALAAGGKPAGTLAGRRVEVRGWATERNGLDLVLASPEALETDTE